MTMLERYRPSSRTLSPRFSPFEDILDMQGEINRLFNQFFGRSWTDERGSNGVWAPAVDVTETEDNLVLRAELPGMRREDIHVSVEGNTLILDGERRWELDEDKESVHRTERTYGSFRRALTLPQSVDPNEVDATYRDGILEIRLAKKEEAKPRLIEVKAA